MKTRWFTRTAGIVLVLIMVWPFVHRGLVVVADVNPWKLFGFAMYCTPHQVKVRLAKMAGNRIRPMSKQEIPPEPRRALAIFERNRASLGMLHSHEDLTRYLAESLPPTERLFIWVEVTTLDPATATLKTNLKAYPVRAEQ